MDKLLRGAGGVLNLVTYDSSGAPSDVNGTSAPDLVTVADSAGATISTPIGVRNGAGDYSAPIPTSYTILDVYTAAWHFANGAVRTSSFEVVGSFLYPIAEFRAFDPALVSSVNYPAQRVVDIREAVEDRFASCARVSFTRRGMREVRDGNGSSSIVARWPEVRRVVAIKIGGVATTAGTVGYNTGRIELLAGTFPVGRQNVELFYEHGYDPPPAAVVEAGKRYGRELIVKGAFDDMSRATSIQTDLGLMRLSQASQGKVGIPEVDSVLSDYAYTGALVG